jgi:hypothetical protein
LLPVFCPVLNKRTLISVFLDQLACGLYVFYHMT